MKETLNFTEFHFEKKKKYLQKIPFNFSKRSVKIHFAVQNSLQKLIT